MGSWVWVPFFVFFGFWFIDVIDTVFSLLYSILFFTVCTRERFE